MCGDVGISLKRCCDRINEHKKNSFREQTKHEWRETTVHMNEAGEKGGEEQQVKSDGWAARALSFRWISREFVGPQRGFRWSLGYRMKE